MIRCCAVVLALLPAVAVAYPIDVEKTLNDTDILVTAHDTDYDLGAVTLQNYGTQAAQCNVRFRNGPEPVRTRKVTVAAGKSADVSVNFKRSIIKLRVQVHCEPSE
jgi:hypothetical protein